MNALANLKAEHQDLSTRLAALEATTDSWRAEIDFAELRHRLECHLDAEEKFLYPKAVAIPPTHDSVWLSQSDHRKARSLMKAVAAASPLSPAWRKLVTELRRVVEHHARVEEEYLYPDLRLLLTPEQMEQLGTCLQATSAASPFRVLAMRSLPAAPALRAVG